MKVITSVGIKILLIFCILYFNPLYLMREQSVVILEKEMIKSFELNDLDVNSDQNTKDFYLKKTIKVRKKILTGDYNLFFLNHGYNIVDDSNSYSLIYEKKSEFNYIQIYVNAEKITIVSIPSGYENLLTAIISLGVFIWIFWAGILRKLGVPEDDYTLKPK